MEKIELYYELLNQLSTQSIVVSFRKKDGDIRVMFGTRNMKTVQDVCGKDLERLLHGFDKKNGPASLNIPVVDMAIGEVRTFSVDRILGYQLIGEVTPDNIDKAFEYYDAVEAYVNAEEQKRKDEFKSGDEDPNSLISRIK